MLKLPTKEQAFSFITGTHEIERIPCPQSIVYATYTGKTCNPYVDGHLRALNYINTKLLDKDEFPCKSVLLRTSQSLSWLRELHSIMLSPLLTITSINITDEEKPLKSQVGTYRITPATNSYSLAPEPKLIPRILQNWLTGVTGIHNQYKEKAKNPTGLTRAEADLLSLTAYESLLLISTVQPFAIANNRIGRLVENALRLQWRLPFKITSQNEMYEKFVQDLIKYQQTILPQQIKYAQKFDSV